MTFPLLARFLVIWPMADESPFAAFIIPNPDCCKSLIKCFDFIKYGINDHLALFVNESPLPGFFVTNSDGSKPIVKIAHTIELWNNHHLPQFAVVFCRRFVARRRVAPAEEAEKKKSNEVLQSFHAFYCARFLLFRQKAVFSESSLLVNFMVYQARFAATQTVSVTRNFRSQQRLVPIMPHSF